MVVKLIPELTGLPVPMGVKEVVAIAEGLGDTSELVDDNTDVGDNVKEMVEVRSVLVDLLALVTTVAVVIKVVLDDVAEVVGNTLEAKDSMEVVVIDGMSEIEHE